jgi:Nif-specific regulatory protein
VPQSAEPLFVDEGWAPAAIIGRSAPMRELFSMMDRVAGTETTVLITGESGTGKELVARALHERSGRAKKAFVAVNCAALPESVIESELFGHERGAFTGAQELRRGRFELADGGTLFLDEIGELSQAVQAKLLRVLQEGEFQRVGGSATLKTDVRVLTATNRDLEKEVADFRFRSDLFWRLNVFPLRVPPLRERRSDIVLLADHFAEKHGRRSGKPILRISSPAIDLLVTYHWPGNVRELENCIERAVILSTDSVIHAYHLPPSLQSADSTGTGPASTLDASLARLERELLVEALKICRGNAAAAARRLGVTERRMGLAIHRYGIDWRRFRTSV